MLRVVACAVLAGGAFSALAQPVPGFFLVGNTAGTEGSRCTGVSADGSVASGWSGLGQHTPGFTWTAQNGRYDFGLEPGLPSQTFTYGISGDATTLVGSSQTVVGGLRTAFRYRGPGTFQTMSPVPGWSYSQANGVSGNGNVVVGVSESEFSSTGQAFRWTPTGGTQGLGYTRPGSFYSTANAVSRDGSTIVGASMNAAATDAFVWTEAGGMRILQQLPGTTTPNSTAYAVNFDGSIVVGTSTSQFIATMWRNGQPTSLGVADGFFRSFAYGVSDDGSVTVGGMVSTQAGAAAIWTPSGGPELLATYLTRQGVQVPSGWSLITAYGVSTDGRTIVGVAEMPGTPLQSIGFVATIPGPSVFLSFGMVFTWSLQRRRRHSTKLVNPTA